MSYSGPHKQLYREIILMSDQQRITLHEAAVSAMGLAQVRRVEDDYRFNRAWVHAITAVTEADFQKFDEAAKIIEHFTALMEQKAGGN
jgi:hypothetical protein